jgi:hypothetical protein
MGCRMSCWPVGGWCNDGKAVCNDGKAVAQRCTASRASIKLKVTNGYYKSQNGSQHVSTPLSGLQRSFVRAMYSAGAHRPGRVLVN